MQRAGVCADSPGVRWGSGGVWCGTVMTVPYIGGCAGSPGILRDRWDVLRNGHNRSLHGRVRIRLDTAIICGAYCETAGGPFPTLGGVRIRRGDVGIGGVFCGTVDARSLHWGSPLSYTSLNAQGNDPTYNVTITTAVG